jgi:hypothetical protein
MIQKENELKAQGGATGGLDSSTVEAKEMPPIGSRVRRGPDWRWENQDDNLPGTVVAHKARGDGFKALCYSHYTSYTN